MSIGGNKHPAKWYSRIPFNILHINTSWFLKLPLENRIFLLRSYLIGTHASFAARSNDSIVWGSQHGYSSPQIWSLQESRYPSVWITRCFKLIISTYTLTLFILADAVFNKQRLKQDDTVFVAYNPGEVNQWSCKHRAAPIAYLSRQLNGRANSTEILCFSLYICNLI